MPRKAADVARGHSKPAEDLWAPPPPHLRLEKNEVHVWLAQIDGRSDARSLERTLSDEERQRAGRYVFARDRNRFTAARGLLRRILSRYLFEPAESIRFRYSSYGKPALDSEGSGADLRFNVSHSERLALFAFARENPVGVDVEFIRRDIEEDEIALRFFSVHEVAALRALPPDLRKEGFFTCWTRKEAYIKAIGEGLSMPLADFDVSVEPGSAARLLATRRRLDSNWSMAALDPGPGYVGAVAFVGDSGPLRLWQFGA